MAKPQKNQLQSTAAQAGITEEECPQGPSIRPAAEEAIAKRAYELWLQRGCPEGSPEEDWYKAQEELEAGAAQFNGAEGADTAARAAVRRG